MPTKNMFIVIAETSARGCGPPTTGSCTLIVPSSGCAGKRKHSRRQANKISQMSSNKAGDINFACPSASFRRLPPPANVFLGPHFSDGKLAPSIAPRFLAFLWSSLPTPAGLFFSLAPAPAWRIGGIWAPSRPGVMYGGGGCSPRPVRLGVMYAGGFPEPSRGLGVQGKPVAVAGVAVNRWWRRGCSRWHSVRNTPDVAPHVEDVPLVTLSLGKTSKSWNLRETGRERRKVECHQRKNVLRRSQEFSARRHLSARISLCSSWGSRNVRQTLVSTVVG